MKGDIEPVQVELKTKLKREEYADPVSDYYFVMMHWKKIRDKIRSIRTSAKGKKMVQELTGQVPKGKGKARGKGASNWAEVVPQQPPIPRPETSGTRPPLSSDESSD